MEGLVKQLLTLSKIEAAPSLALNDIIDVPMMLRVVEREAQTLSHNQHTLSFDVDNTLKVLGSEDELRSAISNLVYNAVNHTPKGTHIAVSWQHTPAGAEFSVEDNGPGIGPSTSRVSPNDSTGWIRRARGRPAGADWDWQL